VDQVLRAVGLHGRDGEPVKGFSLGMKQRLGIAAAMLADPQLLILDEPTNGLDPAGIVEVRSLLRELGSSGRTVLVSSHQLGELEAVCDRLVVIRFGDLLFSGPTSELLARGRSSVIARPEIGSDLPLLAERLAAGGWRVEVSPEGVRVDADPGEGAQINRSAVAAGVTLAALIPEQQSLESVFLALTGSDDGELARHRAETGRAA
jgi:ABC-2 type transport system ATP-binding protein